MDLPPPMCGIRSGDDYSTSASAVLQLSGGPIIPIPPLAHSSDLAGHPSGELHGARALGYISGRTERHLSYIPHALRTLHVLIQIKDSPSVESYLWLLGHAGSRLRLRHELDLCYRTVARISTGEWGRFNIWGLGQQPHWTYDEPGLRISSPHDCTSGQKFGSDVPCSRLSNALLSSFRELHLSGDFAIGNIPPPPEQTQTEVEQWVTFPGRPVQLIYSVP
ncbi:hypothetical protein EDD16DRAFT_1703068 [Pisolithus croceorrhizus]|nr:hypothetical protein EDD16DRAFT_1703068 [Pisolithus croceorrhizus]